jgi:nitrite reductase/ring-hydroxylating ferredoxin subunit
MAWTSLCELADLTEGLGRYVEVDGFQLAVFLSAGRIAVLDNSCPHAGGNLAAGHVEEGCAVCPSHRWAFRLDNGGLRDAGGAIAIRTYPTRLLSRPGHPTLVQADLPMY